MTVKCSLLLALLLITVVPLNVTAQPQLITLSMAASGFQLEPATLATNLFDPNSDFTLAPGTTTHIKNQTYPVAMDATAIGIFSFGNVAAGTSMEDPVDENADFTGGIEIDHGVCLTTGFLSDSEPTRISFAPWVGVEGPNNGVGENPAHDGEVSKEFWPTAFGDEDFHAIYQNLPLGGDPAVLDFNIDLHSPGFLRLSFVFASDEFPAFIDQIYNDSIAILVKGSSEAEESPGENIATFVRNGVVENFTLHTLSECPLNFLKNQVSPRALNQFPDSDHKIKPPHGPEGYYTFYDHEFGGFSKVLTRETKTVLAPGRYKIKLVMEDVGDRKVDSALFVESGSLKLFALAQGDYNGNGCVDQADYILWRDHNGLSPATFADGDGNGDGVVNQDDFTIWQSNVGNSGNTNFRADFNRDGAVNFADYTVLSLHYGMPSCASRFEGDANGDGAVTFDDFSALYQDYGKTSCGCSCGTGAQSAVSGSDSSTGSLRSSLAASPDLNGDGVLDVNELAALDQLVLGTDLASYKNQQAMAVAAQPQREMPDLPVPEPVAGLSEPVSEVAPSPVRVSR